MNKSITQRKMHCGKMNILLALASVTLALQDSTYKACWDIPFSGEEAFCYDAVHWPINEETYYNAEALDLKAKNQYRDLLWKIENRAEGESTPKHDCLSISRDVFCAYQFKRCSDNSEYMPLCDWMCDLLVERCSSE